ncbi:MAG: VanZ family protein [Gloeobacteraceae cyanobacterium ES-bin-144]|nr:VanZ family protein [Verrucomicrobiales bacterium]
MKRAFSVGIALAYIAFIIAAIIIANRGEGHQWWAFIERVPYGDKVGHLGLIGTLSFLCNLAFPTSREKNLLRVITRVTFILFILLSLEELAQAFIPNRTCDFFDWLADVVGLALGQLAAHILRGLFPAKLAVVTAVESGPHRNQ